MSSRLTQFRNGILIIGGIIFILVLLFCGTFLPGPAGVMVARVISWITTPIILEVSFATLGILIVLALAYYNEKRADEFVELDIPEETKETPPAP